MRKFLQAKPLFLGFVLFPTLIAGIYLLFFFSKMYVSESMFALRSNDSMDSVSLTGLLMQQASSTSMDAHIIKNYISSSDMLDKAARQIDLYAHYSDRSHDFVSRLKPSPTREEWLTYWQRVVAVTFNVDTGIIQVSVKAYTSEMAKRINDVILEYSEDLVNQMNSRAHADALRLARTEVQASEERVLAAQAELRSFRDDKSLLDPSVTAHGLESIIAGLESEATSTQAELSVLRSTMRENSPSVQAVVRKLEAVQQQIIKERSRLAGMENQEGVLSSLVGDYAQLVTEEKFAQEQLVKSMAALEAARLTAMAQSRYIIPFQPPTLPEESLFPKPLLYTVFIFFTLLIILGLCSLIIAAIRDHMGV